jgi:hypothetical protein
LSQLVAEMVEADYASASRDHLIAAAGYRALQRHE